MTVSAVAGTFNVLHGGHRALIDAAFEAGDEVVVGITSDRFAAEGRVGVNPLPVRVSVLERYLSRKGKGWRLFVIDDEYGPRDVMDLVDVLVVSEETAARGEFVAREREARGVKPLSVKVVPMVLSASGDVLRSTAAYAGETGCDGDAGAVTVSVGSLNPIKVEAVRSVMEAAFGSARITPKDVPSGVPEQPFGEQTRIGAENRAGSALGDSDYSVGIEAGVFELDDGLYDFQYCAVLDRHGNVSIGMGPGFRYPDDVADAVRSGETVGQAVKRLRGDSGGRGAVWILSGGLIDRFELTRQSVIAAMVPRLSGANLRAVDRA